MKKWLVGFPVVKGITLGLVSTALVHNSGLSTFAAALIIAIVSAVIGAIGVITAAIISTRSSAEDKEIRQQILGELADLKAAAGAARRKEDSK